MRIEKGGSDGMKCDKCGQEMEFGYLNAFSSASTGFASSVSLHWLDYTKEYRERIAHKVSLSPANIDMEAYRCQKCQLIVFSYAKQQKREFQEEGVKHYDEVEKYLR